MLQIRGPKISWARGMFLLQYSSPYLTVSTQLTLIILLSRRFTLKIYYFLGYTFLLFTNEIQFSNSHIISSLASFALPIYDIICFKLSNLNVRDKK